MSRLPERQRSSADATRQLLQKREEEIDRRVADLKARLHSQPGTPALNRSVSQSSDESAYQVNRSVHPRRNMVPSAFSDAERSSRAGSDNERTGRSPYPTTRRISSVKKPSFVPTPSAPQKKTWKSWFCPCHPGRRNAADAAASANARFERQRLLAEEGKSGYGGTNQDADNAGYSLYGSGSYPYQAGSPDRSTRNRSGPRLTPVHGKLAPTTRM